MQGNQQQLSQNESTNHTIYSPTNNIRVENNEDKDQPIQNNINLSPELRVKIKKASTHSKFTIITVSQIGQDE